MSVSNYLVKKKKYVCQNCGNKYHHYKECKEPKKSYGIIAYRYDTENNIEYLMICRRNTIGFVQFIRGQYINSDIDYIQTLFNVMSNDEIKIIKENLQNFENLWEYLWLDKFYSNSNDRIRKDRMSSEKKFNHICQGISILNEVSINIEYFINSKSKFYKEPEWEFPKGRRNINEIESETALREFTEETGIQREEISFVNDKPIFVEQYKSYDNVEYNNQYFLVYINTHMDKFVISPDNKEQFTEVSKIDFHTYEKAISLMRDYCPYKIKLLKKIDDYIKNNSDIRMVIT